MSDRQYTIRLSPAAAAKLEAAADQADLPHVAACRLLIIDQLMQKSVSDLKETLTDIARDLPREVDYRRKKGKGFDSE